MDNETVGKRIKKWRKLKKMTQEQLARKIEMNVKSIQRYETDTNPISIDVLNNIAKALDIKIDNLLFGVSDSNENKKEEVLKTFDIEELLKKQAMLDNKFDEKETTRKRTIKGIQVALITEIGELAQELKNEWNYWKNSTKKINKSKVLEELSDVLHFYLSYINAKDAETKGKIIPFLDGFLVEHSKKKLLLTENLEGILLTIKDFKIFTENKILGSILAVSDYVGATQEEFLKVYHEKWLKNMNERTKEEY